MQTIGIIGAGAWGTALANSFATAGRPVTIWAREPEIVDSLNNRQENELFLPGIKLDKSIKATDSLTEASACDVLLITTPAQHVRSSLESLKAASETGKPFIICAKGVEINTGYLLSRVAEEIVPQAKIGVLTGPTFAAEIARGLPSAVTLAIREKDVGEQLVELLGNRTLRTYLSDDILGAQVGGAVKNVIAIACGVIEGLKLGDSARAALVTRGLAEIARLAAAMGAKKETLMGMCGVGDLILTCSSMQSRNFSLGVALGQGKSLEEILGSRTSVTEGVHTAKALTVMAKNHAVEMPISDAVNKCLSENVPIKEMIEMMLDRPFKAETV